MPSYPTHSLPLSSLCNLCTRSPVRSHVEVSGFTPTAFIYNVEIESDRATAGPAIAEMQELAGKGKGGGGKGGASAKRRGDTALEQGDLTAVLFPDTIRELVSLAAPRLGVRNFVHDGRKLVFTPTLVPLQGGGPGSTDTRASVVVQPTSGPRGSSYRVSLTLTSAQPRDLRPLLSRAGLLAHAQQQRARAGGVGDATTFMEELQVLEVAMRSFFLEGLKWAQIGRQVFPEPRTALRLDLGMELWVGVSQALRPCARGMLLCVDSTGSAVLRAGPVMDLVATQCGGQVPAQLGPADVRRIEGAIKRVKVQLTHLQWKYVKNLRCVALQSVTYLLACARWAFPSFLINRLSHRFFPLSFRFLLLSSPPRQAHQGRLWPGPRARQQGNL